MVKLLTVLPIRAFLIVGLTFGKTFLAGCLPFDIERYFYVPAAAPNVAFIFDCDGTLVNSTPVWAYAQPELLHRHGVDVTVDDFAQFEHLSLEDECKAYHDTWGIGTNGEELYRELSDILIDGYSKVPPREGLLAFFEAGEGDRYCHVRCHVHAGRAGYVCACGRWP